MSSSSFRSAVSFLAFAYRNYAVSKNEFYAIFETLFWPVVNLFTIGLFASFLSLSSDEVSFVLIGIIVLSVVHIVQIDVAYVLLLDMWSMSLEYVIVTPLPFYRMVLSAWIFGVVRGSISFALLAALSAEFFGFTLKLSALPLALFLLGVYLGALLIGIVNCILILIFGRRAEIFAWTLTAIVMIFCGIYYPVSILPEPFRSVGLAIPLTHFLEYFRSFYGFPTTGSVLLGFAEVVVYLILLLAVAEFSMKRARKTGLVLKLSG
ncbi:MAG: ABC transporter permease [Archaeoglobaceae archaeon]